MAKSEWIPDMTLIVHAGMTLHARCKCGSLIACHGVSERVRLTDAEFERRLRTYNIGRYVYPGILILGVALIAAAWWTEASP